MDNKVLIYVLINAKKSSIICFYQLLFVFESSISSLSGILIIIMSTMKKGPCRFKQTCKNFIAGKECPFSHDRCRFGNKCKDIPNCRFFHDSSDSLQQGSFSANKRQFSQPKSQTQCRFGPKCNKLAEGKCFFKHSSTGGRNDSSGQPNFKKFQLPKSETPCQYGARCNMFPLGKCLFKHDLSTMPSFQSSSMAERPKEDTSQSFKNVLSNLCFDFLMNHSESQDCGRLHQYTSSKNIKKIFQVDNMKITKCSIFQYYQQDEQPIYVVLTQGRIVFGQLLNLAKESGMEHINNSSMVFKRCYDRDIAFQNEAIENFYLMHTLSQDFPRMDVMVIKANKNLHICIINTGSIQSFPNNRNILSTIFINSHLLIVFQDRTKLILRFNQTTLTFQEDGLQIAHHLHNFKGYHKKLYGSQIVGSISEAKTVCFLNERLETHMVQFDQTIKDLLIIQHDGSPYALVLSEKQLFMVNLLNFQKKSILQGGFGQGLQFTSIVQTLNHLFLSIDRWGVLIYNLDSLENPAGALCLGDRQWKLSADDRGNLSVVSSERDGFSSWWVFKVRRH